MDIMSNYRLNCGPAKTSWKRANATYVEHWGSTMGSGFNCQGAPAKHLSGGAKLGIGLGIGIPCLMLLGIFVRRYNNKLEKEALARRQAALSDPEEAIEAEAEMDVLPQYSARSEHEREVDSENADGGQPPVYSTATDGGSEHSEASVPVQGGASR
jgi:hypothetical protein